MQINLGLIFVEVLYKSTCFILLQCKIEHCAAFYPALYKFKSLIFFKYLCVHTNPSLEIILDFITHVEPAGLMNRKILSLPKAGVRYNSCHNPFQISSHDIILAHEMASAFCSYLISLPIFYIITVFHTELFTFILFTL